jgi:hypothetical protein
LLRPVKVSHGHGFTLPSPEPPRDRVFLDAAVKPLYGFISGLAAVVHNSTGSLTPSDRATLLTLLGDDSCGLEQMLKDAEIISGQFGDAFNILIDVQQSPGLWQDRAPDITSKIGDMGRARAEAVRKIDLLRNAENVLAELRERFRDTEPYVHLILDAASPPRRWKLLLDLWAWYFDQFYASCKAILAWKRGQVPDTIFRSALKASWPVGPEPSQPYDKWLRISGQHWRRSLAGLGSEKEPSTLRQAIEATDATFAHYDLADSSLQKVEREPWLGYAANMIDSWAALFEVKASSAWETQAESGYIWSDSPTRTLLAAAWSAYSLYAMSEIKMRRDKRVQREWIPVFCLCIDSAQRDAIGSTMGRAAKISKHWTRPSGELVAANARAVRERPDSLEDRVFVLGQDLIRSLAGRSSFLDRSGVAGSLNIDHELVTVPLHEYLLGFLRTLPGPNVLREVTGE